MMDAKNKNSKDLKTYTNKRVYSSATYELRTLFKNECVIIPYTLYYNKVKEHLPEKYQQVLKDYKQLTYEINAYKRDTAKNYDKHLVMFIKKLCKFGDNSTKLEAELYTKQNGKLVPKDIYEPFLNPSSPVYNEYKKYALKGWKNHPIYTGAIKYYQNLDKRNEIRKLYTTLDEKILEKCKELWAKNYTKNHKHINPEARDRFWTLVKGLVFNTIKQLYTIEDPEEAKTIIPELVDEAIGRVYEGLMCFYDPNYKIDTFIYSITMSKISAYERSRVKKEDAPELFYNINDTEVIHTFYTFTNPKLPPILEHDNNIFIERHKSWLTAIQELMIHG